MPRRSPGQCRIALLPLLLTATTAAAALPACADDSEDFVGDPGAYQVPDAGLTEQPLLCPQALSGAFNNSRSPYRWGEERVEVQVDVAVDFRCPACLQFALLAEEVWGDRDDFRMYARLYFHHYPLESIHPGTTEIHVAAAAAAEQGQEHFWALHGRIFELAAEGRVMSREQVDAFLGQERGLDMRTFRERMGGDEIRDFVQWDRQQTVAAGATGTPSVFVCGEKVAFWSLFEQAVDEALY